MEAECISNYISSCVEKNVFLSIDKKIKSFFEECILELLSNNKYKCLLSTYDKYLMEHSVNTAILTAFLSLEQDLPENICKDLIAGGLFHDIGKLYIPKNLLYKADVLTEKEWAIIQSHPRIGRALLKPHNPPALVLDVIEYHHSGYDKKGYPKVDSGKCTNWELIQIVTLADAYDAMASRRSYRQQLPLSLIHKEIRSNLGKQFDPIAGDHLLAIIENMMCLERKDAL